MSYEHQIKEAKEILDSAPQSHLFSAASIDIWINGILNSEPDRLLFHARRVGAIGGSEIDTLVIHLRNEKAEFASDITMGFKTALDVVKSKYIETIPEKPESHLLRGGIFESGVRELHEATLRKEYSNVIRRKDLEDILLVANRHTDSALAKQVRNDIDTIYECDGKIIMIDLKFPATFSGFNPSTYQCQTLSAKMLLESAANIKVDGLELGVMDHAKCITHRIEMPDTPELRAEIKFAAEYFSNMILEGGYPTPVLPMHEFKSTQSLPQNIQEALRDFGMSKILLKVVENNASKSHELLKDYFGAMSKQDGVSAFKFSGLTNVKGELKSKINIDKATDLLENHLSDKEITTAIKNKDKMLKLLKSTFSNKADFEHCFESEFDVRVSMNSSKKGEIFDLKVALEELLDNSSQELFSELMQEVDNKLISADENLDGLRNWQLNTVNKVVSESSFKGTVERAKELLSNLENGYSHLQNTNHTSASNDSSSAPKSSTHESQKVEEPSSLSLVGEVFDGLTLNSDGNVVSVDEESEMIEETAFSDTLKEQVSSAYDDVINEMLNPTYNM